MTARVGGSVTKRWMARGLGTIVLACAGSAVPGPAIACICGHETVTLVWAKGRVFVEGPTGPEAMADATVELRARDLAESDDPKLKPSVTTTDANGMFELTTPPPGEYWIRVSLSGFPSASIPIRIKKGRPGAGGRLAVRLDPPGADCPCADACVAKSERSGNVDPKCLPPYPYVAWWSGARTQSKAR
jgi:hypothetical protein